MEKVSIELPEEIVTMALHVDALTYNKVGANSPEDVSENQRKAAAIARAIGNRVVAIVMSRNSRSSQSLPYLKEDAGH